MSLIWIVFASLRLALAVDPSLPKQPYAMDASAQKAQCALEVQEARQTHKKCVEKAACGEDYQIHRPATKYCRGGFCTEVIGGNLRTTATGTISPMQERVHNEKVCLDGGGTMTGILESRHGLYTRLSDGRFGLLEFQNKPNAGNCDYKFKSLASDVSDSFVIGDKIFMTKRLPGSPMQEKAHEVFEISEQWTTNAQSKSVLEAKPQSTGEKITGEISVKDGKAVARSAAVERIIELPALSYDGGVAFAQSICAGLEREPPTGPAPGPHQTSK